MNEKPISRSTGGSAAPERSSAVASPPHAAHPSPVSVLFVNSIRAYGGGEKWALQTARGLTTRQIADRLYISPKTADHHIQHIYGKIGASTRAAAALWAMQHAVVQ